jgi:hypothetical protein
LAGLAILLAVAAFFSAVSIAAPIRSAYLYLDSPQNTGADVAWKARIMAANAAKKRPRTHCRVAFSFGLFPCEKFN